MPVRQFVVLFVVLKCQKTFAVGINLNEDEINKQINKYYSYES